MTEQSHIAHIAHITHIAEVQHIMEQKGFFPVMQSTGLPLAGTYLRIENPVLYLILFHDGTNIDTAELLEHTKNMTESIAEKQNEFRCTRTVCLTILTEETEENTTNKNNSNSIKDFVLSQQISFEGNIQYIWWHYSFLENRLSTGKDQPRKLLGIEKILSQVAKGESVSNTVLSLDEKKQSVFPFATLSIFLICALLLAVMLLTGQKTDWILRFGLSREGIMQGQFYRLLTAMFFHSGIQHLLANSIYLIYFGIPMERILGAKKYLLLYLLSGLCGSLFSLIFNGYLAVGASGAIFGLLGASLLLTHEKGAAFTGMNYATMLLLSIAALGMGMLDPNVDNFAHVGGFLCGLLILRLFMRKKSG